MYRYSSSHIAFGVAVAPSLLHLEGVSGCRDLPDAEHEDQSLGTRPQTNQAKLHERKPKGNSHLATPYLLSKDRRPGVDVPLVDP